MRTHLSISQFRRFSILSNHRRPGLLALAAATLVAWSISSAQAQQPWPTGGSPAGPSMRTASRIMVWETPRNRAAQQPPAFAPQSHDAPSFQQTAGRSPSWQSEQPPVVPPHEGSAEQGKQYLLLRNDNVMHAAVQKEENAYRLEYENGSVTMPEREVVCVGDTMAELYAFKRGKIDELTSIEKTVRAALHAKLARWCVRYGMVDLALDEMGLARYHDAENPEVKLSEQQVLTAASTPKPIRPFESSSNAGGPTSGPAAPSPNIAERTPQPTGPTDLLPGQRTIFDVRQENAIAETRDEPPTSSFEQGLGGRLASEILRSDQPTLQELEELVREMPEGTMKYFTQELQPLLVKRCGTAQCHGPGSTSEFRLSATGAASGSGRIATQRNLYSTLQWINRLEPTSSPLLTNAIAPHGGMSEAVLLNKDFVQAQGIAQWIRQVAQNAGYGSSLSTIASRRRELEQRSAALDDNPAYMLTPAARRLKELEREENALAGNPPSNGMARTPLPPTGANRNGGFGADVSPQAMEQMFESPFSLAEQDPTLGEDGLRRGGPIEPFTPKDPFDPTAFNRRHFDPALLAEEANQRAEAERRRSAQMAVEEAFPRQPAPNGQWAPPRTATHPAPMQTTTRRY